MKLSTNQKLLLIPLLVIILNTLAYSIYLDRLMFDEVLARLKQETEKQARVVSRIVERLAPPVANADASALADGDAYAALRAEVDQLSSDMGNIRVTIIADNGVVIADSELTVLELRKVKNHAERAEIREARTGGLGYAIRTSATLNTDYLYTAVANRFGLPFTSRVAIPMTALYAQRDHARISLAAGAAITILIVLFMTVFLFQKMKVALDLQADRLRLEELVAERTATLTELQDLGSMLAICNDLHDAGKVVAAHVPRLIDCSGGAVSIANASRNLLEIQHQWGEPWPYGDYCAIADCWALRRSAVHNSSRDGGVLCAHLEAGIRHDVICIPLIAQGESLGVIHLLTTGLASAGETSLSDARVVGEEVAVAVLNLQLRETLKQQALKDPLTTLYNRRFLEEHFAYEIARCNRHEKPMALLVIDVDHFKSFNDTFGHDAGDYVLSQLGGQFKKAFRGEDVVCRLGGEEFAVVLPDTGRDGALDLAEKLRARVAGLDLVLRGQSLGEITISIGISTFPEDGIDLESLLKVGDDALYRAKNAGRNRVAAAWLTS